MNRSIMIVICDFLVLCALSLSSGLSELPDTAAPENPGYRDGYEMVPGPQAVPTQEYEALKVRAEQMKKELEKLKSASSAEIVTLSQSIREQEGRLSEAEQKLSVAEKKLSRTEQELGVAAGKLFRTEQELKAAAAALAQSEKDKEVSAQRVKDLKIALDVVQTVSATREKEITYQRRKTEDYREKLDISEQERKEQARRIDTVREQVQQRDLDLARAREQISSLSKNAEENARSLDDVRAQLLRKSEESAGLQKMLDSTRQQLAAAEDKLRSTSLEKYSSSAVCLEFTAVNVRPLLGDNRFHRKQYIPEIRLGNQIFLPASFLSATGLDRSFSGYTQVRELEYAELLPSDEGKRVKLTRDMIVPAGTGGLCLIPSAGLSKSPLAVLTRTELKKRGLRDLTLFKASSFGTASAELAERCSLDITEKDRSLLIRNSHRRGSELTAEPGDIIITKEGEFAAVVVSVTGEGNGRSTARAFVFENRNIPPGTKIPVVKGPKEPFYNGFSSTVEKLRETLKGSIPEYRR